MKKNFQILLVTLFVMYSPFTLTAQPIAVVPYPSSVILSGGQTFLSNRFTFNKNTNPRVKDITHHFEEEIKKQIGGFNNPGTNIINIEIIEDKALKAEMYRLTILKNKVEIRGQEAGIFYAFQTLTQLILASRDNRNPIPLMVITDSPRFVYRGMHLDVGRHFFPPSYIKKYIDYLAAHKMNTFHWHLTEDQGWRLQIKKYPKLTEVGSCRAQTLAGRFGSDKYDSTRYCGFYTQQEVKDIVQYAKERYITVIPEIDIPGHSLAALAAYPFLGCTKGPYKVFETWGVQNDVMCAGNDSTYTFIENVLDEVMEMFPSKYIHIGGDEAPKERWKECPVCQQKIKNEHLKDEHELQSYFIHRVEKYVNSKGRNVIGWDEILEGGLAPNATVMSWRGMAGGIAAAKQHHKVIMTPETPLYLNFSQTKNEDSITQGGYNPLEAVYAYEPIPASLGADSVFILGAQGNMWTEYASNIRKVEYLLFPRMSALSEVLWSPKSQRNWASFEKRIPALFNLYRLWNANYSTAYYDIQPEVVPFEKGIAWKLQSKNKNGKIIYVHGPERNATFDYTSPLPITKTINMGAALTAPDHTFLSSWTWQQFYINKATGKKVTLAIQPNGSYAGKGGFTLVDGVQNNLGMVKSPQFLGFNGNNLEATIDLDSVQEINKIVLHAFEQRASWIYAPQSVRFYMSVDGKEFKEIPASVTQSGSKNLEYVSLAKVLTRYIKVVAINNGIIGAGKPGAGFKSWLFADEISIE